MTGNGAPRPLRILTFSTLYPSSARPIHGVFVENRLRHLLASEEIEARVLAPVPWFPWRSSIFGRWACFARTPRSEERHGIPVAHPRYPLLPALGEPLAPFGLAASGARAAWALMKSGYDFDLIDAHYFYPDGVAACIVSRALGKPFVVTARGSDLTLHAQRGPARRLVRRAALTADGVIAVSAGLRDELAKLGVPAERVLVLRNGVDLVAFRPPADRAGLRARIGASGLVLLSVGHLIPRKAHDLAIGALSALPGATLLIAGEGPERKRLRALADDLGVAGRVRFLGVWPHGAIAELYGAADVLTLPSSREGWPNVLLEAMACGTPAVASDIPGNREAIASSAAGRLMRSRDAAGLAGAVRSLLAEGVDRAATRAYAERFSWDATSRGQSALFASIIARTSLAATQEAAE